MSIEIKNYVPEKQIQSEMTANADGLFEDIVFWFESFASDLRTNDLSRRYLQPLFEKSMADGDMSATTIKKTGSKAFYHVAKNLLGPIHVAYVDQVLSTAQSGDTLLFAARDSTPFYWIGKTLTDLYPRKYEDGIRLVHADWNRWFMGQEDVTDPEKQPLLWGHPLLEKFYRQMGFGGEGLVKIIEPGAWGSAAKAIKQNMPDQHFELWFLFSHMPDRIFGFLNHHAPSADKKTLEIINDVGEAQPKFYVRPEKLIELENGLVVPNVTDMWIDHPIIQSWARSSKQGSIDAAIEYGCKKINIEAHVLGLDSLSKKTYDEKVWTGMLPESTETWPEGENWRRKWSLGHIPPIREGKFSYEI